MLPLRRLALLIALLVGTLACGMLRHAEPTSTEPPSPTIPTETPVPSATVEPSSTVAAASSPTTAAPSVPSDTATAGAGSMPVPFTNLNDVSQYFNPVGEPAASWNGIPIMPQAIAGQEFIAGQVYSFKAAATISQAVDFYQSKLPALGYTSFMPGAATGSAGTGANAIHNSFLYMLKGSQTLLIYIASYDSDPSHVSVVLSTQ